MNYETYINLILSGNPHDANRYKAAFIPNRLYKYYSLGDDPALNELKLETLSRGEVYLSKMEEFNDPFEGKALYFNKSLLEEKGWSRSLIETVSDTLRNNYRIACFCNAEEKEQNMPMWAYYANNHQGFCVEHTFNLDYMTFLYPVSYEPKRILADKVFQQSIVNTFLYLIIQVPIMLILGLMFASMLNNKDLRFKGLFRTCIFLPCATSLVSYAMIFRSLFANDGFINTVLRGLGMHPIMWFSNAWTARAVIIIALVWRWTGYNMVFYLSGMQNIEYSIYEAAKIDGASPLQTFFKITVPLLKPMILLTTITSTNGTLQLFDESLNLTNGGPGKSTMTMSHYIYNMSFVQSPNFGYAAAMSILILIMVAILALLQMKVGDER